MKRTAIVTGGARGIGAAIAASLHRAGHSVMVADLDLEAAERQVENLASESASPVCATQVDVQDEEQVREMVDTARSWGGDVSILVNNAAITEALEFMEITAQRWDMVMQTNLRSIVFACQAAFPHMVEQQWGRVINLSSVAGLRGGPQVQGAHYATSKAGIVGLTRYLAYDAAPHGITVNAIAPGPIETEQTALAPREKLEAVMNALPARRLGRPDEVGALARFLASDDAGFIVGATIDINGGLLIR